MHTQVGIIGAGPAGLLLGQLLHLKGIDSVILECRNHDYVIDRVRAGVLEQFTVDLMTQMGVGARLHREGMRHDSVYLSFGGERHRVPLADLTGGKAIYVYGQNEVVKDLMEARIATRRPLHYEVQNVSVHNIDSAKPLIRYQAEGKQRVDLRLHRGVRWLPRHLPPGSGRRREVLRQDVSVWVAGHPGRSAAVFRRAGVHLSRAGVRAVQHAHAEDHAVVFSGAAGRRH